MYEIIGPENIALASFSSAEYTVKATDMQGNPPNFKKGEDMVLVVIESDHSLRVTGLENEHGNAGPRDGHGHVHGLQARRRHGRRHRLHRHLRR